MGIFDFFKKKDNNEKRNETSNKKFTKEEVDDLVLTALNLLCDTVSTSEDAKKLIVSKGYEEKQAEIIVSRANQLYLKHFQDKTTNNSENLKESENLTSKKTLNELYAEKNNSKKTLNELFAEKHKSKQPEESASNKTALSDVSDIFTKNQKGIEDSKFNTTQFQNEACALALWKLKENNLKPNVAIYELKKVGLNDKQINLILERVNKHLNQDVNDSHSINSGIDDAKFNDEGYQNEILDYAQKLYFQNNHRYETVQQELFKDGLSPKQVKEVICKLEKRNSEMVNEFQQELDSGRIIEIKITPNPEHTKENVDKDQVDKYIGYGAYQMERGDLENALELFDKALELDENATLAYANKGSLYSLKNENEKALFFLNKALDIEPSHKEILDNKVELVFEMFKENKFDESQFINEIKGVLVNDPENPNALIYVIQFYLKNNHINDAVISVKRLFSNYYSENIAIQLMLDTFDKLTENEALEQFASMEIEVTDEAEYQLYYNKGLYLKGKRKYEEAIRVFDKLNKIKVFSWNYYQMAIMKNLEGKTDESLELLKTTFGLEPGLQEDAKNFPELQNLWSHPKFIEITG
jgi:tetratricopeptide (TPR) repeat protein